MLINFAELKLTCPPIALQNSSHFIRVNINENRAINIVKGANNFCSILFFDNALLTVLNKKNANIDHLINDKILFSKCKLIYPASTNTINIKMRFRTIEIVSNLYISLSDFNLPPQTILYGITFTIIHTCKTKNIESNINSPACEIFSILSD